MTRMTRMIYCPAEMKEIKESAFGTGCAQERSNYFCDLLYSFLGCIIIYLSILNHLSIPSNLNYPQKNSTTIWAVKILRNIDSG